MLDRLHNIRKMNTAIGELRAVRASELKADERRENVRQLSDDFLAS